ncbi:hypothetical protein, partial [Streptomyces sp. NPDC057460]|uniref:hypothetical protein n=1 Tax=Streptomyces sp. NPDC057460 TaxID=3346141 RepID=UPI00367D403A
MRGKIALSAAAAVALVGGMAAITVEPASAAPNQKCRVVASSLTGENFAPNGTFKISPAGTMVSSSSDGRIGPTTVAGAGNFSVGPVACTGAAAASAGSGTGAAAATAAGTSAAQAAISRGASPQAAKAQGIAAAQAKATSLGLPQTVINQVINQTTTNMTQIQNSSVINAPVSLPTTGDPVVVPPVKGGDPVVVPPVKGGDPVVVPPVKGGDPVVVPPVK